MSRITNVTVLRGPAGAEGPPGTPGGSVPIPPGHALANTSGIAAPAAATSRAQLRALIGLNTEISVSTPAGAQWPNLFIGIGAESIALVTSPPPNDFFGSGNIIIGHEGFGAAISAYRNVCVSPRGMPHATTAYHNAGIGSGVHFQVTTGHYLSAIGVGAHLEAETAVDCFAAGGDALYYGADTKRCNTGGRNSMFSAVILMDSTAWGDHSQYSNLTGHGCNSVGADSLRDNVSGQRINVVGNAGFRVLTSGDGNSGIGDSVGSTLLVGSNNGFFSRNAGIGLINGSNNIVVGGASLDPAANGHVVLADGAGTRRLSFDGAGIGTFPGRVNFEGVTHFHGPVRDAEGANRLRMLTTGDKSTEVYSGGAFVRIFDIYGNEMGTIDYYAAKFQGGVSCGTITKAALLATTAAANAGEWRIADATPYAQRRAIPDGANWRWIDDGSIVS
jgi:hypothetical protein